MRRRATYTHELIVASSCTSFRYRLRRYPGCWDLNVGFGWRVPLERTRWLPGGLSLLDLDFDLLRRMLDDAEDLDESDRAAARKLMSETCSDVSRGVDT